jgi:hypothetical protein
VSGAMWKRPKVVLLVLVGLAAIALVCGVSGDALHRSDPAAARVLGVIWAIATGLLLLLGVVLPALAKIAEVSINLAALGVRLARRRRPGV